MISVRFVFAGGVRTRRVTRVTVCQFGGNLENHFPAGGSELKLQIRD